MSDDKGEITIDFSKIKNLFKRNKLKEEQKEVEHVKKEIEEKLKKDQEEEKRLIQEEKQLEVIQEDLKKEEKIIEEAGKNIEKDEKELHEIEEKEEISINVKKIKDTLAFDQWVPFIKKYGIIIAILIPIFLSTFFRMYPSYLPITDNWAQNSVYSSYRSQIETQINQQYPNLPTENKNVLINKEFQKILKSEKATIDQQIKQTSAYFKTKFQDGDGQTYLLAIDPYIWYGQARNYLEYGHLGDKIVDGKSIYSLRNGRFGRETRKQFHPILEVIVFKIGNFFNKNFSLLRAAFLMPVLIIGLSIIPVFFIAKRFGGITGGLFAGIILALNTALLGRTPAGFSDTDPYNILFPLFIAWAFIEAFEAKETKKTIILGAICAFLAGIYSLFWGGWWYVIDFILATIGLYFIYQLIINRKTIKKGIKDILSIENIKKSVIIGLIIFIGSMTSVLMFTGPDDATMIFGGVSRIVNLKDVAEVTLWPNVLTTVAEFNEIPVDQIVSQMGGNILFFLAVIGILLTIIGRDEHGKKDVKYAIFLTVWFIGTTYGFSKAMRFAILMVPAFAIAFGIGMGMIYRYIGNSAAKELNINKKIASTLLILIMLLIVGITPIPVTSTRLPFCSHGLCQSAHSIALNEIPSMSDAWYDSLIGIKEDSEDAIITSWWDFGHWFVNVAERRVTFDGADQGERIHWVGKSLLTDDEKTNIGILRMLNCGQEKAPHVLEEHLDGDTVKAIDILNKIILLEKEEAKKYLSEQGLKEKEIESILEVTHCEDLIDQYYITSEDMIGKAAVWAHFGSWDFNKAKMWQTINGKKYKEGTTILQEEFNLTPEKADQFYYEIQETIADRWISPWPNYMSGEDRCNKESDILRCNNGAIINLTTMDTHFNTPNGIRKPASLVYPTKLDLEEKRYEENTEPVSVILMKNNNEYRSILSDPKLAKSIFTRLFFFDGLGSEHYSLLSEKNTINNQKIQVWKVDWEAHEPITFDKVREGSTVSLNYIGWLDNGTVFDSSIVDWKDKDISKNTILSKNFEYGPLSFEVGSSQVIVGFEKAVLGMKVDDTKTFEIPPEEAYGTDPAAHPLGNQTLNFKIKIVELT